MLPRLHHRVSCTKAAHHHPEIGYWYGEDIAEPGVSESIVRGLGLYTHISNHGMLPRLHHRILYTSATQFIPEMGYWYCAVNLNLGDTESRVRGMGLYTHISTEGMLPRLHLRDPYTLVTHWHPEMGMGVAQLI